MNYNVIEDYFTNTLNAINEMVNAVNKAYISSAKNKTYKSPDSSRKATKLSPPWNTIKSMFTAMFAGDDEIIVKDMIKKDDTYLLIIETPSATKADALVKVLKNKYDFGNVTLKIEYDVTNKGGKVESYNQNDTYDVYLEALASTPAVVDIKRVENFVGDEFVVVEFAKEVVQFYNDDLTDFYGNWNGTYVDVAKEIFKTKSNVLFTVAEK